MNLPFQPVAAAPRYPFRDTRMFVHNAWYVAALASEIDEAPVGKTVLSEPLVLYRDGDGKVVCLEGTCPHRQYPLAHAWKEGDQLRCPYHGFRFGPDGRCTEIPSQAVIPSNCALRAYPVVEQWPWIWVWMGDSARADPTLIPAPEVTWLGGTRPAYADEPLHIGARYQLLNENLLDLSHIPFLHNYGKGTGWARGTDWPEETLDTDEAGRWLRGTRTFDLARPDLPGDCGLDGPTRLTAALSFYPPTFFVARLSYEPLSDDGGDGRPELHNIHAFTPVNERETLYYFASARNFLGDDEAVTAAFRARFRQVLEEDKHAAELIEPLVDRPGRRHDFVARADKSALRARRAVQRLIDAE